MRSQFFSGEGREVSRRYIEDREAALPAFLGEPVKSPCIGEDHVGCEFGIRIPLEPVFHDMEMFLICPGLSGAEYESPMGQALVVFLKFLFRNEVDRGVVIGKI